MINYRSIGIRLTGWYLLMLVIGLGIFGIGSWFAIRASAFHAVDDELTDRIRGVEKFMQLQIASLSPVEIRDEFREHSVLGPGGDLFQVCDERGTWLYRSAVLENSQIAIRLPGQLSREAVFEDLTVQETPVRFATRRVVVNNHPYSIQVATPMSEFFEALHRFGVILWFLVPVLLVGAGIGGFWISQRALQPVDQITAAAESISITNLTNRLAVPATGDELQRLSETMNRMLSRLSSAVQRMSQFTADASHELRAPIAVILTTAELAVKGGRTVTELQGDMDEIRGEADRTRRLIESLLLLARADAGEDGFQMEPSDLTACVREAIRQAENLAQEREATIELVAPDRSIAVSGDADALRRLMFNLLDNAIKYNTAGGYVRVKLSQEEDLAICSVTDSGIGIAAEHLNQIFDRFWRADKVRSRGAGGAGIGLAIARWIVDRHHGTLEVASSVGAGSTFTVKLPIMRVSGAAT